MVDTERHLRIASAIAVGNPGHYTDEDDRRVIARALFQSSNDGYAWDEKPDADELLDNLCGTIFGCSLDEVLRAWDIEQ